MVVVHTALGVVFLAPVLHYLWRHFAIYRTRPQGAVVWMGYAATVATLVAALSGLVLALQAVRGPRISYGWDRVHLVSTFALLAFALPHVLVVAVRDRAAALRLGLDVLRTAERRMLLDAAAAGSLMIAPVVLLWGLHPGERMHDAFPPDYSYALGPERPFAPSLATTTTGGAFDARRLAGSESCGTTGCHEQIAAEWRVSAHRWAAMDPAFQRIQEEMAKQNGPESTRYCGGCHDPISLFSGTKNIFAENLTGLAGYQEGVSCLACHSIRRTDVKGNASFVVAKPSRLASPDPAEPMDLAAAEAHLRRAHAINGEETGPVVRLGEVLLVLGRDGEAQDWLEAALRTNPKSVEAAFLGGFVAWDRGSPEVPRLVRRVREAGRVEAAVKGVLSEGDRKDTKRGAAPPLESPLGRLLFGAPIAALRGRAAAGDPIDDTLVSSLWREARRLRRQLSGRVSRAAISTPP